MKHETLVAHAKHQYDKLGYIPYALSLELQRHGVNLAVLERNWNGGR
jgi:hypothetical protein